jgi:hypothetical protein
MLFWITPTLARLVITGQPFEIPIGNLELRFR